MKKIFKNSYVLLSVVLMGIGAFMLGGLFVHSLYKPAKQMASIHLTTLPTTLPHNIRRVYASSRGTRYYPWWCDAGSRIAEDNKVWYDTPELAQEAGYSIAKGCV